jgi:hypothetical protein
MILLRISNETYPQDQHEVIPSNVGILSLDGVLLFVLCLLDELL